MQNSYTFKYYIYKGMHCEIVEVPIMPGTECSKDKIIKKDAKCLAICFLLYNFAPAFA